ncbi:hypothetical protein [Longimicrobium sp.]|uniref:hypothetical protein n=1 Tax=Longimicrobium sp. TaxID=2029185 RepID=UPI002B89749A|nr:hypothetical protein [Longimicrobium sp.]HSU13268.1 hypothetical protein [Longimicrobium sp.]
MSDLSPVAVDDDDEKLEEDLRRARDTCLERYGQLVNHTVPLLKQVLIHVNQLPTVADGTLADMWFAAVGRTISIDTSADRAWTDAGAKFLPHGAIQKKMIVSRMRGSELAQGTGSGQRHETTARVDAGATPADLWVTEMQNGCTVLILDWGQSLYSMVHLQPSEDEQFNWLGKKVMGLGGYTKWVTGDAFFKSAYKNAWLKQEASKVVAATGRTPQNYIMVQSMYEASRSKVTQVVGVKKGNTFAFYRQRSYAQTLEVDVLKWSGWWSYLPALASRSY